MRDSVPWHDVDGDPADQLNQTIDSLLSEQEPLRARWLRLFSFYYGRVISDWDELTLPMTAFDSYDGSADGVEIHAWNLTRSIVDAYVSRVGLNTPEPRWLTEGADVEKQEQAKLRELFTRGARQRANTTEHAKTALWSSSICGFGAIKTMDRGPDVRQRYMRPDTVIWDPSDVADDGRPRCIYQHEPIDRSYLLAMADDDDIRMQIQAATRHDTDHIHRDRVLVSHAWCRELGKSPGRHVMMIHSDRSVLVDEPWEGSYPISVLHFSRFASGHSDSLASIVEGCARMINRMLWKCVKNHDHLSTPFMAGPKSLQQMMRDNRTVRYLPLASDEVPPQVIAPSAISRETLDLIERIWARGYEISGMSQYSAMGTRPPGLGSGKAIIEHNELQTLRFSDPEIRYEYFQAIELSNQLLSAGKRISESDEGWVVEVEDDSVVNRIDWGDLDQEANWRVSKWPASELGSTPSGRHERIEQLVRVGALDRDEVRQLSRVSDLERNLQLTTSVGDLYRFVLERVRDGRWIAPTEYDRADLEKGLLMARYYRARSIVDGDDEGAERIETWMAEAAAILAPEAQPEQAIEDLAPPEGQIAGALPADPAAAAALAGAQATLEGNVG